MNIVVLDGYTSNPGDMSWKQLTDLGTCTLYDRTNPDQIVERAKDADCILTNKVILNSAILAQLPLLKYIGVLATGYNIIDIDSAKKQGIIIANIPDYSSNSVAQLVFGFILELTHSIGEHSRGVHAGNWSESQDFSYWNQPLIELHGKTLGVIGYGTIAKKVIQIGHAFDMKIIVHTRTVPDTVPEGITFCDLDMLLKMSDVVSLHCPLTPKTQEIINRDSLSKMKPTAYLINTGRGPLVHEQDLADALTNSVIAGAGLDVLSQEPAHKENPLLNAPRCYITPHFAWASTAARKRLITIAADNLSAFIDGNPRNVVV